MDSCSEEPEYEEEKRENIAMPEDNSRDLVLLENVVWTAFPGEDMPAIVQCGHHHDPLWAQCPAQPFQDQMPYPDYLMCPQFTLRYSSITGVGDSGQSGMMSWATEPILYNMMPVTLPLHWVDITGTSLDFLVVSDYNQVECPSNSSEPTVNSHCQASVSQLHLPLSMTATFRTSLASMSYKPCHCTKSKCLKLYCKCFASGVMCNSCNCTNCHNNLVHAAQQGKAIKSYLVRNPDGFRPKISGGQSGGVKGWHSKRCNCKRSGCLKNYCECYEANIRCTQSCNCVGCFNYDADLTDNENNKGSESASVITPAVMETVVGHLLDRTKEAEREQCCKASAQHAILTEFGLCLTQIAKAMFKDHTQ